MNNQEIRKSGSEEEVDEGFCPQCGAPPFSPCTGARGQNRKALHIERARAQRRAESLGKSIKNSTLNI
jgi:hypothetical protein